MDIIFWFFKNIEEKFIENIINLNLINSYINIGTYNIIKNKKI